MSCQSTPLARFASYSSFLSTLLALSIAQDDNDILANSQAPFRVGSALTLSCSLINAELLNDSSYYWIVECPPLDQCFSGNFTQNISTLSRSIVPVLTSVDTGNYTCFSGNETDEEATIEVIATGNIHV